MPLVRYKLRRDTAANWTTVNPTLGPGEPGVESDTRLVKYGDGITAWVDLPYAAIELPSVLAAYADGDTPSAFTLSIVDSADGPAWLVAIGAQPVSAVLSDVASAAPSAFTLSILDSGNASAWLDAIGAQPESSALSDIADVSPVADGEHTVAGVKITTSKGLITSIEAA